MEVRDKAIIALKPVANEDHSDKRGYFVQRKLAGNGAFLGVQLHDQSYVLWGDGEPPLGVIVQGEKPPGYDTIATPAYGGTVKVKLNGDAVEGEYLCVTETSGGAVVANSPTVSEARYIVARALERGHAGELIEAYLVEPVFLS